MMTEINNTFTTSFGKYVPCDRETYKKLKRINNVLHQHARPEANRWNRSQCRHPKNRVFKRVRGGVVVREPVDERMLFNPFFNLREQQRSREYYDRSTWTFKTVTETWRGAETTPLLTDFLADYEAARHPVDSPEQVKQMRLTADQVDALLCKIAVWKAKL